MSKTIVIKKKIVNIELEESEVKAIIKLTKRHQMKPNQKQALKEIIRRGIAASPEL